MLTVNPMELRLRKWRKRRELSLRQLADRAGVSFVTLYRIEARKTSPTVAMLEKLARALRISVREFFPVEQPRKRGRGKR